MGNINFLKSIGKFQTYDLEVNHPDHQYYLSNGMLTSNSHSCLYSMLSYHSAYLKKHYNLPFLVANLMSEVKSNQKQAKENINKIKSEIRATGIKIVPPDINTSDITYKIVDDNTLMTGLDSLKYMGTDALPELLAKRPFKNFKDMMFRLDSSKVRSTTIQALAASGSLDKFDLSRKKMFLYASDYRAKLRAHMNKLLREHAKKNKLKIAEVSLNDIDKHIIDKHLSEFDYPFPKDREWNIRESFALEEFYMGEGISGSIFERYDGFLRRETGKFNDLQKLWPYRYFSDDERLDRKANTYNIATKIKGLRGVISSIFSFKVKKEGSKILGQEMARITVQDIFGGELNIIAFPEAWQGAQERITKELSGGKHKLGVGMALYFRGQFQWETPSTYSFILGDILDYKPSPSLPADLKAKKVKLTSKKVTKEEIDDMDKDDLTNKLEDEVIELGEFEDDEKFPDPFVE